MAGADIGLAPTRHDRFTDMSLSTKVFEYAAMGKPVVASRLPMVERTFPPGTVAAYEPGDPQAMADAILAFADDPVAREAAVAATAEIVEGRLLGARVEGLSRARGAAHRRLGRPVTDRYGSRYARPSADRTSRRTLRATRRGNETGGRGGFGQRRLRRHGRGGLLDRGQPRRVDVGICSAGSPNRRRNSETMYFTAWRWTCRPSSRK